MSAESSPNRNRNRSTSPPRRDRVIRGGASVTPAGFVALGLASQSVRLGPRGMFRVRSGPRQRGVNVRSEANVTSPWRVGGQLNHRVPAQSPVVSPSAARWSAAHVDDHRDVVEHATVRGLPFPPRRPARADGRFHLGMARNRTSSWARAAARRSHRVGGGRRRSLSPGGNADRLRAVGSGVSRLGRPRPPGAHLGAQRRAASCCSRARTSRPRRRRDRTVRAGGGAGPDGRAGLGATMCTGHDALRPRPGLRRRAARLHAQAHARRHRSRHGSLVTTEAYASPTSQGST